MAPFLEPTPEQALYSEQRARHHPDQRLAGVRGSGQHPLRQLLQPPVRRDECGRLMAGQSQLEGQLARVGEEPLWI
jgi:hypothetical protein